MRVFFISKYIVKGVVNTTLEHCIAYCQGKKRIGLDIETSAKYRKGEYDESVYKGGLDPYLTNICMIQLGDLKTSFVIDVRDFSNEELSPLINFIHNNTETTFVGVNLRFEALHLKHTYNIELLKVWDCMVVEMCLYNGLKSVKFSLAGMAEKYLGVKQTGSESLFEEEKLMTLDDFHIEENMNVITPFEMADSIQIDKSTRMQFVRIGKRPFSKVQILYGADDIQYPLLIAERQSLGRLLPDDTIYLPEKLLNLENNFISVVADMQLNGMPFDKEVWLNIAERQGVILKERLQELNNYVITFYKDFVTIPSLFDYSVNCSIEWGSSKQVIALFKKLEICPREFSKQSKRVDYTVGAVALLKILPNEYKDAYLQQRWIGFDKNEQGEYLEDNNKLILAYLLMKRAEQSVTTFGEAWLKYVHPITNKVHTRFRQILNSGRMASSSPNVQQIPNGEYRDAFTVGKESNLNMVFADFSNQEVRTVACLAGETIMIDFFQNGHGIYGDDLHMLTANNMHKTKNPKDDDLPAKGTETFTKVHNKKRNEAKIISFGLLFGKEAKGFAVDFGLTEEEAQEFVDDYFNAYPNLRKAMLKWEKETLEDKYIQIDQTIDRRWFSEDFIEMENYSIEAKSYYPSEYFEYNKMTKTEKEEVKKRITSEFPEVKKLWRGFFGIQGSLKRKATNYRIQGTSASETKASLIILKKEILKRGWDKLVKILIVVHDEIGVSCPEELTVEVTAILKKAMEDGANLFLNPKIMKATPEVGKCWIH